MFFGVTISQVVCSVEPGAKPSLPSGGRKLGFLRFFGHKLGRDAPKDRRTVVSESGTGGGSGGAPPNKPPTGGNDGGKGGGDGKGKNEDRILGLEVCPS